MSFPDIPVGLILIEAEHHKTWFGIQLKGLTVGDTPDQIGFFTVARRPRLHWLGVIRSGNVIAAPESDVPAHVKENAVASSLPLTRQDIQTLDAAHPGPSD